MYLKQIGNGDLKNGLKIVTSYANRIRKGLIKNGNEWIGARLL